MNFAYIYDLEDSYYLTPRELDKQLNLVGCIPVSSEDIVGSIIREPFGQEVAETLSHVFGICMLGAERANANLSLDIFIPQCNINLLIREGVFVSFSRAKGVIA